MDKIVGALPPSPPAILSTRTYSWGTALLLSWNLAALASLFIPRWRDLPGTQQWEMIAVGSYSLLLLFLSIGGARSHVLRRVSLAWNFAQGCLVLIVLGLELLFYLAPSTVPSSLAEFRPPLLRADRYRGEILLYLDENPWIAFRPLTRVSTMPLGDRGIDYVDAWTTDRRGFKNPPSIAARDRVAVVAIGDSFTEGVGVPPEKTWPALLTQAGIPTYNLGLQGAAPIQTIGILRRWGLALRPRLVLFGYCDAMEGRDSAILATLAEGKHPGRDAGVGALASLQRAQRRPRGFWEGTNAILDLAKARLRRLTTLPSTSTQHSFFTRYTDEVVASERGPLPAVVKEEMEHVFLTLRQICSEEGIQFGIVLFPLRGYVYYEPITGASPPPDHRHTYRRQWLQNFCEAHGILWIDLTEPIAHEIRRLAAAERIDPKTLPYFLRDPHMNESGHRLVAASILPILRERGF